MPLTRLPFKELLLLQFIFVVTQTGCSQTQSRTALQSVHVTNGEIVCIVKEVKSDVQKQFGIEGTRTREKPISQDFRIRRSVGGNLRTFEIGSFDSPPQHDLKLIAGTDLFIHSEWRGVFTGLKEFKVFDARARKEVGPTWGSGAWSTPVSRSGRNVFLRHGNKIGVAETATLVKAEPVLREAPKWEEFFQTKKEYFHHTALTDDGKFIVCFPEGMAGANQILIFGPDGKRFLPLPQGLRWNDLIDAESIDGKLIFVTRNFGSGADSYQIVDEAWNILHTLPPPGRNLFRPVWDFEKSRLIFPPFTAMVDSAGTLKFLEWDYKANTTQTIELR